MLELHDRDDLAEALDALDEGIFDDLAEPPGKAQQVGRRKRLGAEKHYAVVEPDAPDGRNGCLAQLVAEIDAANLGPECTRDRPHLDWARGARGVEPRLCALLCRVTGLRPSSSASVCHGCLC